MTTQKQVRSLLAMVLVICLTLSIPLAVVAESEYTGEIIAFASLADETAAQTVALGTSLSDLDLPENLTATAREDTDTPETTVSVPVSWTASPAYDGESAGIYVFTPEISDEYTVAEGVPLPTITVTVGEDETLASSGSTEGEIIAFASLADETAAQTVALGTPLSDLDLPETLTATVLISAGTDTEASGEDTADTEEETVSVPVTWSASPAYDGEAAGTYVFTPEISGDYTLAADVYLPTITVTVTEEEATTLAMSLATTLSAQDVSGTYTFDVYYGDISITSDTVAYCDTSGSQTQVFSSGDELVITQTGSSSSTSNNITVNGGTGNNPLTITLSGVNIDMSSSGGCTFELQSTSKVNLTLADGAENTLVSGGIVGRPANGGNGGDGGTLTITGGIIQTDTIGGGNGGDATVTITGSTFAVTGNMGGGNGGSGGDGDEASDGSDGSGSNQITGGSLSIGGVIAQAPTNGSGTNVYLTSVTLHGAATKIPVYSLTTDAAYNYGVEAVTTDTGGNLYIWLSEWTAITCAATTAGEYTGSVTTTTNTATSYGTLSKDAETVKPTVIGVTPSGDGVSLSGDIEITFSEAMDTGMTGAVSIDSGGVVTGGAWSNYNKMYTLSYSVSSNYQVYTIHISGFADISGNTMEPDDTHSFTTVAKCGNGTYVIESDGDSAYTGSYTDGGLLQMTVNSGQTGFTYFSVKISVDAGHTGNEICVFVHMRYGVQISMNATMADFDTVNSAYAAFNVKAGDVIEVYIVDVLSNAADAAPAVL